MKKFVKVLVSVLTLALLVTCFASCGDTAKEAPRQPGANNPNKDKVETIDVDVSTLNLQKEGVLVMGTNAAFPPFEYLEGADVVGLDAEMMQEVADRLGLELEIKDMAFDSLPESLQIGEIDCIAAGLTVDPDREEVMSFTDGYYVATQTIIVKADSTIASAADLNDKAIGCQSGTTGQFTAEGYTTNVVPFENGAVAVDALLNGQVDAVIIDDNPAKEYGAKNADTLKLLEGQFEPETYAVAVKKDNTNLRDAINKAIAAMKADGTFDEIVAKYIK